MRKTNAPSQPFGRLIAACGILLAVVLVSALMTTFLQKPNLDALADNAATAAPEVDPTPTPEPTITPTPAVYAPFGAQYGYGGANLIPETPTPDPVNVTPTPTAAPTDTPKPTKAPTRTLKKNFTGEDVKQLQQALIRLIGGNEHHDAESILLFHNDSSLLLLLCPFFSGRHANSIAPARPKVNLRRVFLAPNLALC